MTPDLASVVRDASHSFSGHLLLPSDARYDAARRVHNGLIDKRPALIAQCRGTADIVDAIAFARTHGLRVSVRGGGHNVAGRAVVDGGLMIDLSLMRSVVVDPGRRTARAEGGVTWKEFNRETQQFGLATTGGVVGSTGVAGLTLGGGFGWLMPKYGMSLDNLLSVNLVLADGRVVRASATDHPDLFWAVRGGGGNFGVASSFEFQLHPVGPMVTGGLVAWPLPAAREVIRFFRDLSAKITDDMFIVSALLTAPDGGPKVVGIAAGHFGQPAEAEAAVAPIKKFGSPIMDKMGPLPYVALNGMLDEAFPKGALNYWKSHFLTGLDDGAIDAAIDRIQACPTPMGQVLFEHFHGASTRVPVDATAYAMRSSGFNALVIGEWLDPAQNDVCTRWAKESYAAFQPYVGPRRYLNYLAEDDMTNQALVSAYGPNLARLRQLKRQFDPDNFFRENLNIR